MIWERSLTGLLHQCLNPVIQNLCIFETHLEFLHAKLLPSTIWQQFGSPEQLVARAPGRQTLWDYWLHCQGKSLRLMGNFQELQSTAINDSMWYSGARSLRGENKTHAAQASPNTMHASIWNFNLFLLRKRVGAFRTTQRPGQEGTGVDPQPTFQYGPMLKSRFTSSIGLLQDHIDLANRSWKGLFWNVFRKYDDLVCWPNAEFRHTQTDNVVVDLALDM
mmetsp:Transcript_39569/g.85472  ORF Transcript_39569/g.85472 Transcript_39569/m.85472 type:complete len:220 (+) Transcript_39569:268-927(+)